MAPTKVKLCIVCLRCDAECKSLKSELVDFHDDICDFQLPREALYCRDCEHLMKKYHKFHQQCVNAIKIYKQWKATKACTRPPINSLHSLLSPSLLAYWTPKSCILNMFIKEGIDEPTYILVEDCNNGDQFIQTIDITEEVLKTTEHVALKSEKDDDSNDNMTIAEFLRNGSYFKDLQNEERTKNEVGDEIRTIGEVNPLIGVENRLGGDANGLTSDVYELIGDVNKQNNENGGNKLIGEDIEVMHDNSEIIDDNIGLTDDESVKSYKVKDEMSDEEETTKPDCGKKRKVVDENMEKFLEMLKLEGKNDDVKIKNGRWPKVPMKINIEKLKKDLDTHLDNLGVILAKDGTPIHKEIIMDALDKRMCGNLPSLWRAVRIGPKPVKECIQFFYKKYQNDVKLQHVFDIEYLSTFQLKVEEFEKRKTYEHYKKAKIKCEKCFLTKKWPRDIERHNKDFHDDSPENTSKRCPICKVRPRNKHLRHIHSTTHYAVYKCKECTLVTYKRAILKKHEALHAGKKYECKECDASFRWMSAYSEHLSKYHMSKDHVCTTCGRGFGSAMALKLHTVKRHQEDPPPEEGSEPVHCATCDVTFPSSSVHATHVQDVHGEQPTWRPTVTTEGGRTDLPAYKSRPTRRPGYAHCNVTCDVTFPSSSVHATHVQDVHGEQPTWKPTVTTEGGRTDLPAYKSRPTRRNTPRKKPNHSMVKCKVCSKSRLGGAWLKHHFKKDHPTEDYNVWYAEKKKHLCDVCGKSFSTVHVLRHHMTLHTGARPFPCDLCPKAFRCRLQLKQHRASHLPPTNACEVCGNKYKTVGNLFQHMKVHTAEMNYKCDVCGRCFLYGSNLRQHVQHVHNNVKRVRRRGAQLDKIET